MKYRALVALALAGISAATVAYATPLWSVNAVLVTKIDVEADHVAAGVGEVYLKFSAAPHATTCSNNASGLWVVGGNPDSVKAIQAVALAAKLSGTQVKVLFNPTYTSSTSCHGGGSVGYPVLRGLEMQ